jgi:putative phage-type endonuclease
VRVIECQQNTPYWLKIRTGRITACRMADVMAKPKRGAQELRRKSNYRMELLCERLTGRAADHYVSRAMEHGAENEPFARAAYEVATETMVDQVGFMLHPMMDFSGASPDSLVGTNGGLEIKCPETATHLEWMEAGVVPEEHQDQMMWNMECGERDWWDFLSFDPRLPIGIRCFIARLHRDEVRIAEMEMEVQKLHAEVEYKSMILGAPEWHPLMPERSTEETELIGALHVPRDIAEMLEGEIIP